MSIHPLGLFETSAPHSSLPVHCHTSHVGDATALDLYDVVQEHPLAPGQALAVLVLTADLWYGPEGPNFLPSPQVFVARTQDLTPPAFTNDQPVILAPLFTSARVSFQLDEPGTVYYAVAPTDAALSPSAGDVRDGGRGMEASGFMAAGEVTVSNSTEAQVSEVVRLTSLTNFTLWAVAEDRYGNLMLTVAERRFTTLDDQPPQFLELQVRLKVVLLPHP